MRKFSVIIPTFNRADLLERCLNSLVFQTYVNFEVLVCDDGSTDNTLEVVLKYQDRLDLKYFFSENWGGPARPRNIGIINSTGEWLCFLDSDDFWTENKLEIINEAINSEMDLIYHKMYVIKGSSLTNLKILPSRKVNSDSFKDLLINGNFICNSAVVVRKSIIREIGGINESKNMIGCEDFNTWLRIAHKSNKIFYMPYILGFYDLHLSGISRKDMSFTHLISVKEFISSCTNRERKYIFSHVFYMKLSFGISQGNPKHNILRTYALYCMKFGTLIIKLKAAILFLQLSIENE